MGWRIVRDNKVYLCIKNHDIHYKTDSLEDAKWYVNLQKEFENDKTPLPNEVYF